MPIPSRVKTRHPSSRLPHLSRLAVVLAAAPVLWAQPPQSAPGTGVDSRPLAIVPVESKIPGAAAEATGGVKILNGRAYVTNDGTITSGSQTALVTLPYRGTLRVCASTTVKLTADSSVSSGEIPGLMMAMDHGAVEASFATGRDSDFLLTPDFRILISGPGAAEVKVRLGPHGDTCVDNAGTNAPYVLVTSVFDNGTYRVQSGQRVMFQHGSLHEMVDQEKEPCGCPGAGKGANDFPLAQSEGLAPTLHPAPVPQGQLGQQTQPDTALVYNAADHAPTPAEAKPPETPPPAVAPPAAQPSPAGQEKPVENAAANPPPPQKKPGIFKRVGKFFRKIFGAE